MLELVWRILQSSFGNDLIGPGLVEQFSFTGTNLCAKDSLKAAAGFKAAGRTIAKTAAFQHFFKLLVQSISTRPRTPR